MNKEHIAVAVAAVRRYDELRPRPRQVTQTQAAEMLGVSVSTISRMLKAGLLRLNKFGMIPISEIDSALAAS